VNVEDLMAQLTTLLGERPSTRLVWLRVYGGASRYQCMEPAMIQLVTPAEQGRSPYIEIVAKCDDE